MTRTPIEPGLLLVDKPAGVTSHDVVQTARRGLGERRMGHTGTLDPFATGLLLLCAGSFTRAAEYFHELPKTYEAVMRLGRETDTDDLTGETLGESDAWTEVSEADVSARIKALVATHRQVPSSYSAKRVDGVRAYDAAREGRDLDLEAVPVTVHDARLRSFAPPDVDFDVTVSTGTYVRALARDLGRDLGVGAHLTALRRTRIGPFSVDEAFDPGSLAVLEPTPPAWRPAATALEWLERRELTGDEAIEIGHGRPIDACGSTGTLSLVVGGRLAAIGLADGHVVRPRKVFPA